jgi:hypothetical protein
LLSMPDEVKTSREEQLSVGSSQYWQSLSEEEKALKLQPLLSSVRREEAHHRWLGDSIGYGGLHEWVRRYFGVPDACERCGKVGPVQAHNVPKTYKRDKNRREDWLFVCSSCHAIVDPDCGKICKLGGQ